MKMKKTAMLLTALALGVFAAHAGAAEFRYTKDYQTVEEAFQAMQDGDTLVVTEDTSAAEEINLSTNKFHETDVDDDGNAEMTIDLNGHTLTLSGLSIRFNHIVNITESKAGGKLVIAPDGFISMNGGILNIESGIIEGAITSQPSKHDSAAYYSYINVNGGQIIGADSDIGKCAVMAFWETVLKINAGSVDGKIYMLDLASQPSYEVSPNEVGVTGGTFTDKEFVDTYVGSSLIRDLGNGSYAVGEKVTATVATENVSQQTIGDTTATGFVTTITSEDKFDLKTIKWDVTYNNEKKSTSEYKLDGVTLNGDAKIGLAVDGFADASATAAATINGYIK